MIKRLLFNGILLVMPIIGMIRYHAGACLTPSFMVLYAVIPAVAVVLYTVLTLFRVRGCWIVMIGYVAVSAVVMASGTFAVVTRYDNEEVPQAYEHTAQMCAPMPPLSEIGETEWVRYCHLDRRELFFFSDTDALICRYDAAEYEAQKQRVEQSYYFQEGLLTASKRSCGAAVDVGAYHVQTLTVEGVYDSIDYPQRFMMIATNDAAKEIVYLMYHNTDLDDIADLGVFLLRDGGWQYIICEE